jgi:Uma2 family endonuclease
MLVDAELPHTLPETHIMGMPRFEDPVTSVDQLLALPDDGLRHELLDGEHVVTPAPAYRHQAIHGVLYYALMQALKERTHLKVMSSPADLIYGPKLLVQPDLFVFRRTPGQPVQSWRDVGTPVLAIEILSPSTAARDRGKKRQIYQRLGVDQYWIVDPDSRLVECWRPAETRPEVVAEMLRWFFQEELLLELPVVDLFADLPDANDL